MSQWRDVTGDSQSEASIQVTWSLSANQRPVQWAREFVNHFGGLRRTFCNTLEHFVTLRQRTQARSYGHWITLNQVFGDLECLSRFQSLLHKTSESFKLFLSGEISEGDWGEKSKLRKSWCHGDYEMRRWSWEDMGMDIFQSCISITHVAVIRERSHLSWLW